MKKQPNLLESFDPASYRLYPKKGLLIISGQKLGRPSKRITLHQKGLKVTDAQIIKHDKKGDLQKEVSRINHLPTFEQVRIHGDEMLYPGKYTLRLSYRLPKTYDNQKPSRNWLPSIDEPAAWANATLEIK